MVFAARARGGHEQVSSIVPPSLPFSCKVYVITGSDILFGPFKQSRSYFTTMVHDPRRLHKVPARACPST